MQGFFHCDEPRGPGFISPHLSRSANPDIDGAGDANDLGGGKAMGVLEEIDKANVLRDLEGVNAENPRL